METHKFLVLKDCIQRKLCPFLAQSIQRVLGLCFHGFYPPNLENPFFSQGFLEIRRGSSVCFVHMGIGKIRYKKKKKY